MSEELRLILLACFAFVLTVLLVPVVRRLALHWDIVSLPSTERWHQRPTPRCGGIAFFFGWAIPLYLFVPALSSTLPLFVVTSLMFLMGLYDDLYHLNPATKLVGQLIAAALAVFFGYSLSFFPWPLLDALLTMAWIVGLTNALNLLDNMDGLAGGIGLIAALYLAVFFHLHADVSHQLFAGALAGALAGFLLFNFFPASIFMGDAGSLFVGSGLSLLTIQAHGEASNIFSLVAVPAFILLVPILDTTLVTLTRLLRGQPISQGGTDHSSHRLVTLGLSERKAVLLLYAMAALSGATALVVERLSYTLSFVIVPCVVLLITLFTAHLAQVEIILEAEGKRRAQRRGLPAVLIALTYKRRLLEVGLDFFLIIFAYYTAFAVRFAFAFDLDLDASNQALFLTSLPLVLIATYCAFFVVGVYRGVWHHTETADLKRLALGAVCGTLIVVLVLVVLYRFSGYSRIVFLLYPLFLFLTAAGTRLSFRLFHFLLPHPLAIGTVPVLIYGAGNAGVLIANKCRKEVGLGFQAKGFIDDDPDKQGAVISGLPVFGGVACLEQIIEQEHIQGLLISSAHILADRDAEKIRLVCRERGVWIEQIRVEFVEA